MAEVKVPRPGRSLSTGKVSVAASQKRQARSAPFKFLRKDEGRLSYSCTPESPVSGCGNALQGISVTSRELISMDKNSSRSLREAIANDMRKGKANDPFGGFEVAVPKRGPPPSASPREDRSVSREGVQSQEAGGAPSARSGTQQAAPHLILGDTNQSELTGEKFVSSKRLGSRTSEDSEKMVEQQQPPQQRQQQQHVLQPQPQQHHHHHHQHHHQNHLQQHHQYHQEQHHPHQQTYQSHLQNQSFQWQQQPPPPLSHKSQSVRSRASPMHSHVLAWNMSENDIGDWSPSPVHQRRWRNGDVDNGHVRQLPSNRYSDAGELENEFSAGGRNTRNYFRPPLAEYNPPREDDELVGQLEGEIRATKEERSRYYQLRLQLERERQRFEEYRAGVERDMEDERAHLDAARVSEQRLAKKDARVVEERYRSTLELLRTERDSNAKLTQENEMLRQQLEMTTVRLRESQKLQKLETSRLRREIESLTRRNEELLELAREQQLAALERGESLSAPLLLHNDQSVRQKVLANSGNNKKGGGDLFDSNSGALRHRGYSSDHHRYLELVEREIISEPDENERKRIEEEERRHDEIEERLRRVEADGRRRAEEEENMRRRVEAEQRLRAKEEEDKQKRAEGEGKKRKVAEAVERQREDGEKEAKVSNHQEADGAPRRQVEAQKVVPEDRTQQSEDKVGGKRLEASQQRRSSGHPVLTPRALNPKTSGSATSGSGTQSNSCTYATRKSRRIPTATELISDNEPVPPEDFPNDTVVSQTSLGENPNKREVLYRSGKREIHYTNGTRKLILPTGHVFLYFSNGDIKRTFPSGKSTYWYAAAQTTHTQYADKIQVFQFHSSGQVERHLPDGKKEILYPDGMYKVVYPDGRDETIFPDPQ